MTEAELAEFIGETLSGLLDHEGWEISGLDIGEINVTTPFGKRFRIAVIAVTDEA